MAKYKAKVGFAAVATDALDLKTAEQNAKKSMTALRKLGAKVVSLNELIKTSGKAREAAALFKREDIDFMVLQVGTWCPDNVPTTLTQEIDIPFVLWAIPEVIKGGFPDGGMLVGLTQIGGTLTKYGKKFEPLLGAPDDAKVIDRIRKRLNAAVAARKLKRSKVGLFGFGCPGMTDTRFHEVQLRKTVGPEVVHVDLGKLALTVKSITDAAAKRFAQKLKKTGKPAEPSEDQFIEAAKVYLAMRRIVNENDLNAIAVKCWPELRQLDIMSPCFALSRLSDEGVMAACEGDLTGAVTMMMLNLVSGQAAGLCDIAGIEKGDTILGFHCGAAASALAKNKSDIELRLHAEVASDVSAWKKGVTVEFPVKPAPVTFARLGEIKGEYRLLIMTGKTLTTKMFVRGNPIKAKLDGDAWENIKKLIAEGSEHHQLFVLADVKEDLVMLAEALGIRAVCI